MKYEGLQLLFIDSMYTKPLIKTELVLKMKPLTLLAQVVQHYNIPHPSTENRVNSIFIFYAANIPNRFNFIHLLYSKIKRDISESIHIALQTE